MCVCVCSCSTYNLTDRLPLRLHSAVVQQQHVQLERIVEAHILLQEGGLLCHVFNEMVCAHLVYCQAFLIVLLITGSHSECSSQQCH